MKPEEELSELVSDMISENAKLKAINAELLEALQTLTTRYKELVDSGDCGFWDAEKEPEYISAIAAINKAL